MGIDIFTSLGIDANMESDDSTLGSGDNMYKIILGRKEPPHIVLKILLDWEIPRTTVPK
jgi:hypothetical protein